VTARILTDDRGRPIVRYLLPGWVGDYTATSQADAETFAADPARWAADRAFAIAKWQLGKGAGR